MATTTNYGWTTPNDTDLVKDGAAAIRTLGSSVDTTTKALNPSTTLGDVEYRSATANTNTRLGIGTNGQYLTVSGGVPAWGDISAGGQTLLSTTSLTGASITISSIPTTYNDLYVYIENPYLNTVNTYLQIQPNSSTTLATFRYMTWTSGSQGNFGVTNGSIEPAIDLSATNSPTKNIALLKIYNYANTTYGKNFEMVGTDSNADSAYILGGGIGTASAITSLKITTTAPGSRTFSGGQVRIYGVK